MTWDQTYRSRRRDRQKLFVVNYADGSRAFLRVPHEIAAFGVSPPASRLRCAEGKLSDHERSPAPFRVDPVIAGRFADLRHFSLRIRPGGESITFIRTTIDMSTSAC